MEAKELLPINDLDRALSQDVEEILANHVHLKNATLKVVVQGGVAHLFGNVSSEEARSEARHVLARVKGIQAVWDVLQLPGEPDLEIVDLGCGLKKQKPTAVGVDKFPHPGVDVICDVEKGLPFADESVDHAYAVHFLEHVVHLIDLMNDIHRVLKPHGVLHVIVPDSRSVNAVADPTHVRFFDRRTFNYFCQAFPGVRTFRPLCIGKTRVDIFADLQPVKSPNAFPSQLELARFFS